MKDPYIEKLRRFLKQIGGGCYQIEPAGSGHRWLTVIHGGRRACVAIASTGSDQNGPHSMVRDLRHQLGLVGARRSKKPAIRRRRPHRKRARPSLLISQGPSVTLADRYYGPLAELKRWMELRDSSGEISSADQPGLTREPIIELRTPFLGRKRRFWGLG